MHGIANNNVIMAALMLCMYTCMRVPIRTLVHLPYHFPYKYKILGNCVVLDLFRLLDL